MKNTLKNIYAASATRCSNFKFFVLMVASFHLTACHGGRSASNTNPHAKALRRMEAQRARDAYAKEQVAKKNGRRERRSSCSCVSCRQGVRKKAANEKKD